MQGASLARRAHPERALFDHTGPQITGAAGAEAVGDRIRTLGGAAFPESVLLVALKAMRADAVYRSAAPVALRALSPKALTAPIVAARRGATLYTHIN